MALQVNANLIEQVKLGNEKAFEELYRQAYKHVYFLAYKICRSDDDAKEVAQLTFLQIHKSIGTLRDNRTFSSWLRRIVVSKCYNLFEHNRDAVYDPDESVQFRNEKETRRYMLPQAQARFQFDHEIIMSLIDSLPEKYRTVLVLMHFEGLSMLEIKAVLNIPEGTVKSRLSTARKMLKEKVEDYEQQQGISLDFHNVDAIALASVYTASFGALQVSIPALTGSFAFGILPKLRHLMKTAGAKVAVASVVSIGGVGSVMAYQAYEDSREAPALPKQTVQLSSQLMYQPQETPFTKVVVYDTTYEQAKDAYFALVTWAHCDIELSQKSEVELQAYAPLYESLKQSNGKYYHSLQSQKWSGYFEKYITK